MIADFRASVPKRKFKATNAKHKQTAKYLTVKDLEGVLLLNRPTVTHFRGRLGTI